MAHAAYIGIDISNSTNDVWRGTTEANKLKTNGDLGFNVIFGGWMTGFGNYNFIGEHANFWCSTEYDEQRGYERLMGLQNGRMGRDKGNKECGFSVRYVKD